MLNTPHKIELSDIEIDEQGNDHVSACYNTPMKADAFVISDEEKIKIIAYHFESIMNTLGLDLTDDSLKGTPKRVAKMYVKEVFSGLNPDKKPKASTKFLNSNVLVRVLFSSFQLLFIGSFVY